MPPRKAIRTRRQVRQRSLLEYDTVRSSKSETRHSQTNTRRSRSKQDEAEHQRDEHMKVKHVSASANQENKTRLQRKGKGKGKEKRKESPTQSESESDTPQIQKASAHLSPLSVVSGSEDEFQASIKRGARAIRRKPKVAESDSEIEVLEPKDEHAGRTLSGRATKQRSLLEYATPRKNGDRKKFGGRQTQIYESGSETDSPRKIRFEPRIQSTSDKRTSPSETSSDSERKKDDEIVTRFRSRQSRRRTVQKSSSNASPTTSNEEDISPAPKRRKDVALPDDEDPPSPLKRRRLIRGSRPRSPGELFSEDEQLIKEAAEEEESILSSRFRNRSRKNEFVKNLERLKKKKQHKRIENREEEDDSQQSSTSNSETESARLQDDIFPDARPAHLYGSEGDTPDQDDDFIVDDDEGAVELPPMFNMGTFQDLSHHFKVACQLFVHLSIKKRSQRTQFLKQALESTYFSVPLAMSRRKLLSMRDSLVASSIWRSEFRKPLEIYPEFKLQHLDFAVPHCDACNLSSRLSTFQGRLRGQKYDRSTYQSKGKEISIDWNLGRFCAARAQVFHKLTHWEFSLFQTLDTEINSLRKKIRGHVVESRRDIFMPVTKGPPPPDELDDADGWMEWLDGRGIIEAEWREIKDVMDRAHNLEAKGKGDDHDVEYS